MFDWLLRRKKKNYVIHDQIKQVTMIHGAPYRQAYYKFENNAIITRLIDALNDQLFTYGDDGRIWIDIKLHNVIAGEQLVELEKELGLNSWDWDWVYTTFQAYDSEPTQTHYYLRLFINPTPVPGDKLSEVPRVWHGKLI